jgi:hypothetical protein
MLRSLAAIAAAINLSAPTLPDALVDSYAETVRDEALEHELDPMLMVSIVYNESRWQAGAVNGRSNCLGLGGICLGTFPACQQDPRGEACMGMRVRLLIPTTNLQVSAAMLESNREYCENRFKSVTAADWLGGYQGFGVKGVTCGRAKSKGKWRRVAVPGLTRKVLRYRDMLVRKFG